MDRAPAPGGTKLSTWHHAALAACLALGVADSASAAPPAFSIAQAFSNADGTIQFVVMREATGLDGEHRLSGATLTATGGPHRIAFTFPGDLRSTQTARRSVLMAMQGYIDAAKDVPALAAVAPDYVLPDRFLPTGPGSIDYAGLDSLAYAGLRSDGFSAVYSSGETIRDNRAQNFSGANVSVPVTRVTAIEYRNAALDHYFISDLAPDIEALDSGRIAGWARTGESFSVWPSALGFLEPVCRYYIPPAHGNSHFFCASGAECGTVTALAQTSPNYSGYVLEAPEVFFAALPFADGSCPTNWRPIYRLWNNRADSNHRYTIDPAIKKEMVARGYVPEGYGPDATAMCSPLAF